MDSRYIYFRKILKYQVNVNNSNYKVICEPFRRIQIIDKIKTLSIRWAERLKNIIMYDIQGKSRWKEQRRQRKACLRDVIGVLKETIIRTLRRKEQDKKKWVEIVWQVLVIQEPWYRREGGRDKETQNLNSSGWIPIAKLHLLFLKKFVQKCIQVLNHDINHTHCFPFDVYISSNK